MVSRRTALALVAAAGLASAALAFGRAGGGDQGSGAGTPASPAAARAVVVSPSAAASPGVVAGPSGAASPAASSSPAAAASPSGSDLLAAADIVERFCRLVDGRRLWQAEGLLAAPHVWPRRELRAVLGLRFVSAELYAHPDADTVQLIVRARVVPGRGCPLPRGTATLFFTLGRVGTTEGAWLITAVTTSP